MAELPEITADDVCEITVGRFIDTTIDIQLLKDKLSGERFRQLIDEDESTEPDVVDEIWEDIASKLGERNHLIERMISNGWLAPWEIEELEQQMIDAYYEQQTEEL